MYSRLLTLPLAEQTSLFLFGPRGTGKTSWIHSTLPNTLYFDLLDSGLLIQLQSNPARLEALIPPSFSDWIVIDEVQKIPELLDTVHRLIESHKLRFLLTGSSARSLRRHGTNLLAGRAWQYNMHPLTPQELAGDFNLERALKFGLLPSTFAFADPQKYLETYVQTYLREEVLQEGITRNIGAFSRFLEVASFSQGSLLNVSEVAREVGIDRQVVASYFDILEDLLLATRIFPFTRRAKRKMVARPKFYYFDVGVFRVLRPTGPLDSASESDGAALETLFFQLVRALNDYFALKYTIHYWQTQAGHEVDFVLYGPNGLLAFEIKRTSSLSSKALTGLKAFCEDYPEAKAFVLFGGARKEYHGNITAIPFKDALEELPQLLKNPTGLSLGEEDPTIRTWG